MQSLKRIETSSKIETSSNDCRNDSFFHPAPRQSRAVTGPQKCKIACASTVTTSASLCGVWTCRKIRPLQLDSSDAASPDSPAATGVTVAWPTTSPLKFTDSSFSLSSPKVVNCNRLKESQREFFEDLDKDTVCSSCFFHKVTYANLTLPGVIPVCFSLCVYAAFQQP